MSVDSLMAGPVALPVLLLVVLGVARGVWVPTPRSTAMSAVDVSGCRFRFIATPRLDAACEDPA